MVYADSLNSISAPGFKFADANRETVFERSIDTVAGLKCGILLTPHPEAFDRDAKLASRAGHPTTDPFIEPDACKVYAAGARERLAKRLAEERATP
jgi:metallo-beta-lactamase class B